MPEAVTDDFLHLCYGEDILDWIAEFSEKTVTRAGGLTIFDGPPGTGKTSLITQMIRRLEETHVFYALPVSQDSALSSPDLVPFWQKQNTRHAERVKVIVLEDAERLLWRRSGDNPGKRSRRCSTSPTASWAGPAATARHLLGQCQDGGPRSRGASSGAVDESSPFHRASAVKWRNASRPLAGWSSSRENELLRELLARRRSLNPLVAGGERHTRKTGDRLPSGRTESNIEETPRRCLQSRSTGGCRPSDDKKNKTPLRH